MSFLDRRTIVILLTALIFAVVLAIVYIARAIFVIFAFSILFAYLINPVVRFLQRHSLFFRNLRGPHVVETYLGLVIFLAIIVHTLAPGLIGRAEQTLQLVPALTDRVSSGDVAFDIGNRCGWNHGLSLQVKSFLKQHHSVIQRFMGASERFATAAIGSLVVIPILSIFFLSDGENLSNQLVRLISTQENYASVRAFVDELNTVLRHYIRAKVILGALSFVIAAAGMLILGLPHPLTLGLLAGILEFVPIAGWITAATTIIGFGIVSHSQWIWMAVLLGIWRMLIDYWIAPRVFGHELEIHPLLAIFTLMVGGAIGGLVGIYLSLPLVAVLRVVWRRFAKPTEQSGRCRLYNQFEPSGFRPDGNTGIQESPATR